MAQEMERVSLAVIAREWGRIGCIGFGGPPAHIALLRTLCVKDRGWLSGSEFEDGVAVCNLLPGPASTQLAIYCAWRLRGPAGALVGGCCFICPGLVVILALASVFLAAHPPGWVSGAALGAGAAVPAVAVAAAVGLVPASWQRAGQQQAGQQQASPRRDARLARARWSGYLLAGGASGALLGPWLVLVLAACGLIETAVRSRLRSRPRPPAPPSAALLLTAAGGAIATGGLAAVAWVALKVGALSYGGGFVIIPLMQRDAVHTYHWMSAGQFLTAVALGQVTPGPVVQTVAVVGYAAAGAGGGLLAAAVAFAPSFAFVLGGGRYFDRLRGNAAVQAFLTGAGPAAIGAIAGAAIPLGLSLDHLWQAAVLAAAAVWLLAARRGVVTAIVGAAVLGVITFLAGGPVT
ncbi:MAG TPA: chromate efflux transporter [Streptosporangiaceae bacterium]|nr:chromate efflux transporter [Streptosporangiaceae bacterium]